MSSAEARLSNAKEWIYEHRGPILASIAVVAAILILIALTLSWFLTNSELSTVGKVDAPAELKIMGPNQTATEQLDLTYDADSDDAKTTDGKVIRRRAFCVKSGQSEDGKKKAFELQVANTTNIKLQVANTTNIKDLEVHVYRATVNDENAPGDVTGRDGAGKKYSWSKGAEVTFDGTIASDTAKKGTFGDYGNVQSKSVPTYRWKKFSVDDLKNGGTDPADATNFIIECSWSKSENMKESDVAYLIARSAGSQS